MSPTSFKLKRKMLIIDRSKGFSLHNLLPTVIIIKVRHALWNVLACLPRLSQPCALIILPTLIVVSRWRYAFPNIFLLTHTSFLLHQNEIKVNFDALYLEYNQKNLTHLTFLVASFLFRRCWSFPGGVPEILWTLSVWGICYARTNSSFNETASFGVRKLIYKRNNGRNLSVFCPMKTKKTLFDIGLHKYNGVLCLAFLWCERYFGYH